jgi:APA family basic amino acid/polyamine antiporter
MQQTVKLQPKESQPSNQNLKKQVGALDAITMVIGIVIGSGIFFKSSPVFSNAGSPFLGIMAWIIGGLLTVASALTISEIATAIPKTGGLFVYIKELYSEKWAFLFGWVQSFIYVPGVTAALSIIFVTQATFFIPMSDFTQKILAISLIFFLILVNIAIINVIPVDAVIASQTPASDAAVLMFGKSGAILISAGIMISIFGAMNGYLLSCTLCYEWIF